MINKFEIEELYEKSETKMTHEEAKVACAYWKGKYRCMSDMQQIMIDCYQLRNQELTRKEDNLICNSK